MKYLTKSILHLPQRKKNARKGDYGRVLIIGGSIDYIGAPALAAQAALAVLRGGADLVTVVAPEKVAWAINCLIPDIITVKVKGSYFQKKHLSFVLHLAKKYDVVLIGCGMGRQSDVFIRSFVKQVKKPLVIDADALKCIRVQDVHHALLTPHRGEYQQLMQNSHLPIAFTQDAFNRVRNHLGDNVVLLKAPVDVIMGKKDIIGNKTGNPVMAKGGTGDVLAGLCASFLAQKQNTFKAACIAAYLNGAVGDYLLRHYGRTFIASDIVSNIYKVFK